MKPFLKILIILIIPFACKESDDRAEGKVDLDGNPNLNQYVFANKGEELVRLDPATGNGTTFFRFDEVNVSSLDYQEGVLYVGAMDNSMNAIDIQSKKLLWDIPLIEYENTVLADPDVVVKDGVAYASGKTGVMVAVDVKLKKLLWATALAPGGETKYLYNKISTPVIADDKLIIGTSFEDEPNYVHVLDKNTGERVWSKQMKDGEFVYGSVKVAENTLLINGISLQAWELNTGHKKWEYKAFEENSSFGIPVIDAGRIYVQASGNLMDGLLLCIDLHTGNKIWEQEAGITSTYSYVPKIVGKYVFAVEEHGGAYGPYYSLIGKPFMAEALTGKIIWKNDKLSVGSSPVYANGQLFFYGYNPDLRGTFDDQKGFISMEASTGKFLWVNPYFGSSDHINPIVVAENGVFKTGQYD